MHTGENPDPLLLSRHQRAKHSPLADLVTTQGTAAEVAYNRLSRGLP
jgi:hypothetical protein